MSFSNSKLRSGLFLFALISVGIIASACVSAHAQGLVGAPVDPRIGGSGDANLADYGYDTARDISRVATGLTGLFSAVAMSFYLWQSKAKKLRKFVFSSIILLGLPTMVHLLCTYYMDNVSHGCSL